ncbi:A-agglutinin anchorage subunit-like [Peromyscus leucopus]|uniref:A-agglutinin anchorage subunit-like n=1 Tax=Peromyscus leucopus TaxID=10041 RepID=UPI0018850E8F|nr:A-agglutinin anchorage subunit-like [Peromyscus leucopus]
MQQVKKKLRQQPHKSLITENVISSCHLPPPPFQLTYYYSEQQPDIIHTGSQKVMVTFTSEVWSWLSIDPEIEGKYLNEKANKNNMENVQRFSVMSVSSTCTNGQEAQSHACWCLFSNDVTGNASSNLSRVMVSPGILARSECQSSEPCNTQSLWKVFLASLLASVLTTAIGVLTLSLVNRNNSPIVIQLPSNTEASTVTPGTTSTTAQNIVTTSTGSTTTTTSPETTATTTSTEPARTSTSTQPTTSAASTETSATTATAITSSGSMSIAASTQTTTSGAPTEMSAKTMDSTQHLTTLSTASSETISTTSVTETNI